MPCAYFFQLGGKKPPASLHSTKTNGAPLRGFGPWVPFLGFYCQVHPQSPPLRLVWGVCFDACVFLVHMNQNALRFQSSTSKKKMGRFGTFFKVGHSTKVHQVYKFYLYNFAVDAFNLSSWGLGTNLLEFASHCCQ